RAGGWLPRTPGPRVMPRSHEGSIDGFVPGALEVWLAVHQHRQRDLNAELTRVTLYRDGRTALDVQTSVDPRSAECATPHARTANHGVRRIIGIQRHDIGEPSVCDATRGS